MARCSGNWQNWIALAFIYGSIAKGSDNAGSDIDLMLLGEGLAYADVYAALASCEVWMGVVDVFGISI